MESPQPNTFLVIKSLRRNSYNQKKFDRTGVSTYTNAVSIDTNASGLELPSLVGRDIANPD
jgi:hypothetical protein